MEPARLPRRLLALVYDSLLLIAIWMLAALLLIVVNGGEAVTDQRLLWPYLFLVSGFYYTLQWQKSGQTLGLKAWQLRLQHQDGRLLTAGEAWWRFTLSIIAILPFGLGLWWMLFDPGRRSWQDLWTPYRVVDLRFVISESPPQKRQ